MDEVFVKIGGKQPYLWQAVDQEGEIIDGFIQSRREGAAAERFFKRLLRKQGEAPRQIVTDKLRSYGVAHRALILNTIHDTAQYASNRAELSHQSTRVRKRGMRRFKSTAQAQRFLNVHAAVCTLFNLGRHFVGAEHYKKRRVDAFGQWTLAVA